MKIKYAATHPTKAGQTDHINNIIGQTLIALGQAELVPLPRRGSSEWLEARLQQSALAGTPHKDDVSAGFVEGVEWGVRDRVTIGGQILIVKKFGHETVFFTEPPKDCPKSIVQQFKALKDGDPARAEQLEAARRQQSEYEASIATARRY